LDYQVREPEGDPAGALVLFHGRGADEFDLHPLLDFLDPERRLLGVTPRGPLSLPPGGAHWYVLREVGYPDQETFLAGYRDVGGWLDEFLTDHRLGHDETVLGGFSQGAVMAYAFALGAGRPRPAALIGLSGFIPSVDGFELDLSAAPPSRSDTGRSIRSSRSSSRGRRGAHSRTRACRSCTGSIRCRTRSTRGSWSSCALGSSRR
jgi:phospholipase/carboxylesterase